MIVEEGQSIRVDIEDRDVGAHADGDAHRVAAGAAGPRTTTRPGLTPGAPASRTPLPPCFFLQVTGADLHRHAAGDFAHRAAAAAGCRRRSSTVS